MGVVGGVRLVGEGLAITLFCDFNYFFTDFYLYKMLKICQTLKLFLPNNTESKFKCHTTRKSNPH